VVVDAEKKKRKTKKQDNRIARPAYLRPLKKIRTKKDGGSKTQRFETRSKDRVKKSQLQGQFIVDVDDSE
jgi:hypothetical protein